MKNFRLLQSELSGTRWVHKALNPDQVLFMRDMSIDEETVCLHNPTQNPKKVAIPISDRNER